MYAEKKRKVNLNNTAVEEIPGKCGKACLLCYKALGKTNFFKLARQLLPSFTVFCKPIRFLQSSPFSEFGFSL